MRTRTTVSAGVLSASMLLALAACSSGTTSTSGESAAASGEPAGSEQVLTDYFTAFATQDSGDMKPMLKSSAPGSPAFLYARHQINGALAGESANVSSDPSEVTVSGDSVTLVDEALLDEDSSEAERQEATTVYKDFTFAPDGRLDTWTSEPGGPLAPRVKAQSGSGSSGKVTVKASTSYVTNDGDLAVTYTVRNKSNDKAQLTPDGYLNPNRRQVDVSTYTGMLDLSPGAFADERASIDNGQPGGKLIFQVYFVGSTSPMTSITVPIAK
ncbi:MAG: hypothetical protein V9E98_14950 [Candidatus Nanopelagicales bacterium]